MNDTWSHSDSSPTAATGDAEQSAPIRPPQGVARSAWKLLPGVTPGTDDYLHSDVIAEDYDNYFSYAKLFQFDRQIIAQELKLQPGDVVADLGCGTGRALIPLVQQGAIGWAIDLSEKMLQVVQRKADSLDLDIHLLRTNLVQLECVADEAFDGILCLFSTLGMIHGHENRQRVVSHMARILKPGGRFVLHVHNYWNQVADPGGWWYVTRNCLAALFSRHEIRGDRYYPYRGLPKMYLHTFSRRELTKMLQQAGLQTVKWYLLNPTQDSTLSAPWWMAWIRASGWIVVGERV